jgi:hypothetical protein
MSDSRNSNGIAVLQPFPENRNDPVGHDEKGLRITRCSMIDNELTPHRSGVILWDDGKMYCGSWAGVTGLFGSYEVAGGARAEGIFATSIPLEVLEQELREQACAHAREKGSDPVIEEVFRVNDKAYLFTFRGW